MKKRLMAFLLAFIMSFSTLYMVNAEEAETVSQEILEQIDNLEQMTDEQQTDENDSLEQQTDESIVYEYENSEISTEETKNSDINLDSEVTDWTAGIAGAELTVQASDGSVTISRKNKNKGKWSQGADTFSYYAPSNGIDITKDFILSATMNINALNNNGDTNKSQSSAGVLIMGKPGQTPPSVSLSIAMQNDVEGYMGANVRTAFDSDGNYKVQDRIPANKANNSFIRLSDVFSNGVDRGTFDVKIEKVGYTYIISCGDNKTKYNFAKENFMGEDGTNTLLYPALFGARDVNVTFSNIKLEVEDRVPESLEIITEATDNTAIVKNEPKLPGLVLGIKYTDGSVREITDTYELKNYDKNVVGKQTAKITVGELSCNYEIEILKKTATKIKIESIPIKTSYYEGQYLSTDNLVVKADYNDGYQDVILKRDDYEIVVKDKVINDDEFFTTDLAGDNIDFVIRRKETEEFSSGNAIGSFKGSVSSLKFSSLIIDTKPVKTKYYINDKINLNGMIIKGTYSSEDQSKTESDFIDESEYSVKFMVKNADGTLSEPSDNFDTSSEGTRVIQISSKFNPSIVTSFEVPVIEKSFSEAYISSYPRTTYPCLTDVSNYDPRKWFDYYNGKPDGTTGTEDDETKQYNRGNIEITYLYSNGAKEIVPENTDTEGRVTYKVDLSNFDLTNPDKNPNQIRIYFPAGSFAYGIQDIIIPITIKDDFAENYWKPIIFGASSAPTQSVTPGSDEEAALPKGADDNRMGIIYKNKVGEETHFDLRLNKKGSSESTAGTFNSYTGGNLQEEGSSLRIWAKGRSGKLADSNDGMSYYYTRLSTKDGFKLSADIKVNSYIDGDTDENRDGLESFGIMARDIVSLLPDEEHTVVAKDSKGKDYVRFVYKPEEAIKDANGEPEPYSISTYNYSNMVLLGGYSGSSWPNDKEASNYLFNATKNRVNLIYRTFIENDPYDASPNVYRSSVQKVLSSSKLPPLKNDGEYDFSDAEGFPSLGKRYHLVLERIKGGYKGTCYDYQSKEFKTDYIKYDEQTEERDIDVLDPDNLYVGFFAARNADIDVSNVQLLKTDLSTSIEAQKPESQKTVIPKLNINSSKFSTDKNYELVLSTKNLCGGYVTIQQNGKNIFTNALVKNENTAFPIILDENSSDNINNFTIKYTPAHVSEDSPNYEILSSYDPIYYEYSVTYNSNFNSETKFIYAAADGKGTGSGTPENPITFEGALDLIQSGQSIILFPGVYNSNNIIEIPKLKSGSEEKRYSIIGYNKYQAEEEGYAVNNIDVSDEDVIFDLGRKNTGFLNHASYWTFKNFHIRNGGINAKAFHSGGNNCIIENIKIYDCKDSGLCISRTSSDQVSIYDWPSNNIIKNCEVWNCADSSYINADGFAIKLTVGYGNKFIGCVSHHNSDDGWDLFCKQSQGLRAPVTLENCIAYKNGYELTKDGKDYLYSTNRGSKNGFKMGGDNMPVNDILINCITFENGNSGITSNSNPKMTIDGCVGYKNKGSNFSLYSSAMEDVFDDNGNKIDTVSMCDYKIRGVVSYKPVDADFIAGYNYDKEYNYLSRDGKSVNSADKEVTDDFFVSLVSPLVNGHIPQDPKIGDFILSGFLELTESVKNQIQSSPGYNGEENPDPNPNPNPNPVNFPYGDADGNNILEVNDAVVLLNYILDNSKKMGIQNYTENYLKFLDVDKNGRLGAQDVSFIIAKLLNNIKFPVEKD